MSIRLLVLLALALLVPALGQAQTSAADQLFEEYGLRLDMRPHPHFDGRDVAVITEVAPESVAAGSNLALGAMLLTLDSPRLVNPIQDPGRYDADSFSQEILTYLDEKPYIWGSTVDFGDYAATDFNALMAWQREAQSPFLFPLPPVISHLGLRLGQGGLVTEITGPSPATQAGLQIGDRIRSVSGGGIPASRTEPFALKQIFENVTERDQIVELYVERAGQTEVLWMEPLPIGETVPGALPPEQGEIFALLPEVLQPIFTSFYTGDLEATYQYQQITFRNAYDSTALSIVMPALGLDQEMRDRGANMRLEAIMAQYILIKSNELGLCGQEEKRYSVSETIYEVTTNGYGVELSRDLISRYDGEYAVPLRFARVIEHAEPIRELAEWSGRVQDFVTAAGGCDSPILIELERQMLTYLDYRI